MYAAVDVHYPPAGGARAALVLALDAAFRTIVSSKKPPNWSGRWPVGTASPTPSAG